MSAGARLHTRLTTFAGTSALVSTRVYPVIAPQNAVPPFIVYQRISGTEQQGSTAIREARYQCSVWGETFGAVQSVATQVRAALEEWGITGGGGVFVRMARVANEFDDWDEQERLYRTVIDVILTINE
jgi:asparagine synthetase A